METITTTSGKTVPTAKKATTPGMSRRDIREKLRAETAKNDAGASFQMLGYRIFWARRFHTGRSGRWNPTIVLSRSFSKKNGAADAVVLPVDEAVSLLFESQPGAEPDAAKKPSKKAS